MFAPTSKRRRPQRTDADRVDRRGTTGPERPAVALAPTTSPMTAPAGAPAHETPRASFASPEEAPMNAPRITLDLGGHRAARRPRTARGPVAALGASLLAAALALVATPVALAGGGGPGEAELITDRVMVRLPGGVPDPKALAAFVDAFENDPLNAGMTLEPIDEVPGRGIHLLALSAPPGTDFQAVSERIEANYLAFIAWGEMLYDNDAPEGAGGATGSTFVDSVDPDRYRNQYVVPLLGLEPAAARATGAGIAVAVLDSGIDPSHPELAGRVLPGIDFADGDLDANDAGDGMDTDGDGQVDELVGHGTYVAGLIALVAPDAKLVPVRVLDADGIGDHWLLTRGLYWAIDRGVEVINVSIRSTYDSNGVEDAIEEARALGIVTVAAAGNFNLDRREFPAAKSAAIGVAALDHQDVKANFSSYGDRVALSAPGDSGIVGDSSDPATSITSLLPGGDYGAWEGTSLAAPLVAGAAALVRSQHPEWVASEITANILEATLTGSSAFIYDVNPAFAEDEELGAGRLDVHAAVLLGPPAPELGDLDGDGLVGFADLSRVLADWGLVHSSADLDADGVVGLGDLLVILTRWD